MSQLTSVLNLFRQGFKLDNSDAWKDRNAVFNMLVALVAVATAFGFKGQLSADDIQGLAAGVVGALGVWNSVVHVITHENVGVRASDSTPPPAGGGAVDQNGA